jgi:hypothetical protein
MNFDDLQGRFMKSYEKGMKGIDSKFAEQMSKASDQVVLQKLQQAEGGPLYGTAEKEARKRGLI